MLQERFFHSSSVLFVADGGKIIVIPNLRNGQICMQKFSLSDTPSHLTITGIYCYSLDNSRIFINASCVPSNHSGTARCHIITYSYTYTLSNICNTSNDMDEIVELHPIQNLAITYYPLALQYTKSAVSIPCQVTNSNITTILHFLLVTDCDSNLHAYEIQPGTGKLERSSARDQVTQCWVKKFRTSSSSSVPLRMIIEDFGAGTQGVIGYLDGRLCWHRENYSPRQLLAQQHSQNDSEIDWLQVSSFEHSIELAINATDAEVLPPGVVEDAIVTEVTGVMSFAMVLDNAITALEFYSLFEIVSPSGNDEYPTEDVSGGDNSYPTSAKSSTEKSRFASHLIVGQASGLALLIDLSDGATASTTQLINGGDCLHGAVQALATGNVSLSDCNDIVIGHEDGTVVLLQVMATSHNETTSIGSLTFVSIWSVALTFPVVGIAYGPFLGEEAQPFVTVDGSLILPCQQLVLITERSTHIYTHRDLERKASDEPVKNASDEVLEENQLTARVCEVDRFLKRLYELSALLDKCELLRTHRYSNTRVGAMEVIHESADDDTEVECSFNVTDLDESMR